MYVTAGKLVVNAKKAIAASVAADTTLAWRYCPMEKQVGIGLLKVGRIKRSSRSVVFILPASRPKNRSQLETAATKRLVARARCPASVRRRPRHCRRFGQSADA